MTNRSRLVPLPLLAVLTIAACSSDPAPTPGAGRGPAATGGGDATGGVVMTGGGGTGGGIASGGGGTGGAGAAGEAGGPGAYALPPPSQCHNQDYIDYQEGCIEGDASSRCGGKCSTINACLESSADKPHADVAFICPRFMLFSAELRQAAIDDGNSAFNYAVVGHDVDRGGIDGDDDSTCCQCYQLVYAYPSPNNDRQVLTNPDDPEGSPQIFGESAFRGKKAAGRPYAAA